MWKYFGAAIISITLVFAAVMTFSLHSRNEVYTGVRMVIYGYQFVSAVHNEPNCRERTDTCLYRIFFRSGLRPETYTDFIIPIIYFERSMSKKDSRVGYRSLRMAVLAADTNRRWIKTQAGVDAQAITDEETKSFLTAFKKLRKFLKKRMALESDPFIKAEILLTDQTIDNKIVQFQDHL